MSKYNKLLFCFITFITLSSLACCTFKNSGNIRPDNNVTTSFKQFQINKNYNYYISGSDVYPTSILGLHKSYKLETDLWKQIEITPELFTELVTNMNTRSIQCCSQTMHGFSILNDKDEMIGVWYSLITGSIYVKFSGDNDIIVYPPREDDAYRSYEGKLGRGSGVR
jgi:hypothetical protein